MLRTLFCFVCLTLGFLGAAESYTQELTQLIPRTVLFGNPEKTAPSISPDGKQLAYLAPVNGVLNIWVKTVGKQDGHPVSHDIDRGVRNYRWAYNNMLLYRQDKGGDEKWHIYRIELTTRQTVDMTPFEKVNAYFCASNKNFPDEQLIAMKQENKRLFDVYHLNLITGALELREKNPGNISTWIADCSLHIRAAKTFNPDGSASLLLRATEQGTWETAITWKAEDAINTDIFGFSLDGKKLYWKDSSNSNTVQLIEYDCSSKQRTVLTSDPIFDVTSIVTDTNTNVLAAEILKDRRVWQPLNDEFAQTLRAMQSLDTGDLIINNRSVDNRYWVIGFLHDATTTTYYVFDTKKQTAEFLFAVSPELNNYQLAPMKPILFTSRDDLTVYGYLTCPVGVEPKNLPLVLLVHGGPWGRNEWGFDSEAQWLANRGYACLQVNFRGSTGYGKTFVNAGDHEWGAKMHDDLIDAVNWTTAQGIADPQKITIYGCSYGGYAALIGATFTPDVFCCAVDICGISNLITWLNSFPPYWESYRKKIMHNMGTPEKDAEFLKSRSPLFKVDNIKIPVLIGQGANDPRVTQAESEQIVAALKTKNLPYEYILFPDEGHGFAKPENRLKFNAIAEKFLAKHLGGRYEEHVETP